ncbi:MAG: hypothetical protein DWP95_09235 [Proteobacteria bacterium]|nr:MAG: hypothetical protein DWP95_09235 [Pseudomonadota bacterium]
MLIRGLGYSTIWTKRAGGLSTFMLTNVASGWDGLPDNALYDKACWIKITNLKQQNDLMGLIYKGGLSPPK